MTRPSDEAVRRATALLDEWSDKYQRDAHSFIPMKELVKLEEMIATALSRQDERLRRATEALRFYAELDLSNIGMNVSHMDVLSGDHLVTLVTETLGQRARAALREIEGE